MRRSLVIESQRRQEKLQKHGLETLKLNSFMPLLEKRRGSLATSCKTSVSKSKDAQTTTGIRTDSLTRQDEFSGVECYKIKRSPHAVREFR